MHLPETDAIVTFAHHQDEATRKHFNNTSLEINDFDDQTGLAKEGAPNLLKKAAMRE